jgi:ribosome-associated heat shock protein Hsp15
MNNIKSVRIDKYLWAVRIFKTRSLASDACRMGRIIINDAQVKPSRMIDGNEIVIIKKPPVIHTFRVKKLVENRLPAKLTVDYIEDLTPENEKIKLEIKRSAPTGFRKRGLGRPTKKERRTIDKWKESSETPS